MKVNARGSLGVYRNFWEYRFNTHRRLLRERRSNALHFNMNESLEIARQLEEITETDCYKPVKLGKDRIYVHLTNTGEVELPLSKTGYPIRSSDIEFIRKNAISIQHQS